MPPAIVGAINRQTEQYYLIQEYKFRVEREAQESNRKQIEANGTPAFQQTVSKGISDSYLRWRGIEATLALAQSSNSKIVVIGSGKDGLPITLGNVDAQPVPAAKAQSGINGTTPPSGAPPAATEKPSDALPNSNGSTEPEPRARPSGSITPPVSERTPTADLSAARANLDKPGSAIPHDLSDIEAILSRISGALRSAGSPPSSTGAQPKQ